MKRQHLALLALLASAACAERPAPPAAREAAAKEIPFDPAEVARRADLSFRPAGGGGFESVGGGHAAWIDRDGGIAVAPAGAARPGGSFRTEAIGRGRPRAIGGRAVAAGDGSLRIERGPAVERIRNGAGGVEQSWEIARRPAGAGDLVVRVRARGLSPDRGGGGALRFVGRAGAVRYGAATWIDARGNRSAVPARRVGSAIELRVAAALVDGAAYPAVLDPVISPEIELDAPVRNPFKHSRAEIAFDGTNYLVTWVSDSSVEGYRDLRAVRVAPDGRQLDGVPLTLGRTDGNPHAVVFNGTHYLAAFSGPDTSRTKFSLYGRRVAPDGTPVDPSAVLLEPVSETYETSVAGLGWQGNRWLLTYKLLGFAGIWAQILDPDLSFVASGVTIAPSAVTGGGVGCDSDRCLVVWSEREPGRTQDDVYARYVSTAWSLYLPFAVATTPSVAEEYPEVACSAAGMCLAAWRDGGSTTTYSRASRVSYPAGALDAGLALGKVSYPQVAFDGTHFVAVGSGSGAAGTGADALAVRVSTDGRVLDATPIPVCAQAGTQSPTAVGAAAADDLVLWIDYRASSTIGQVYGGRLSRDGVALDPSGFPIGTPMSSETMTAATRHGQDHLAVWLDDRDTTRLDVRGVLLSRAGVPRGPSFSIGQNGSGAAFIRRSVAVANDGASSLVVWPVDMTMFGVRISAAGAVVDAPPAVVVDGIVGTPQNAVVTFGATRFLVSWYADPYSASKGIYFVRVPAGASAATEAAPVRIDTSTGPNAAAWDGSNWLVAWRDGQNVRAARVTDGGTVLEGSGAQPATAPIAVASAAATDSTVGAAYGGGKFLVVYAIPGAGGDDLVGRFVATDGTLPSAAFTIAGASGAQRNPAVAWDGTAFVVAWEDSRGGGVDLYSANVDSGGVVAPAGGAALSAESTDEAHVSIAPEGAGRSLVAYERLDPRVGYGTVRARARFLANAPLVQGAPCAFADECGSGFCVDGVCCQTACGGGVGTDCRACSIAAGGATDGLCLPASTSVVCRAANGVCDVAESCDGAGMDCPADGFAGSSVTCRAAGNLCDVAEACDGTSRDCPADQLAPQGTTCRAKAGGCDVEETCTGSSAACPADTRLAWGTLCAAATEACESSAYCTGQAYCPSKPLAPGGYPCGTGMKACENQAQCNGYSPYCPSNPFKMATAQCRASAGACDAAEYCTGTSGDCPADAFQAQGTSCRAAAGDCDVAESCDGASAACPNDGFADASVVCRAAAGDCDVAESCTGADATCPVDLFRGATYLCRGPAGDCDVGEACTGSGADCPADGFLPATTVCRGAAGDCDVAETCTGSGAACPGDGFLPATTVCRGAAGDCDVAETCTGSAAGCPTDAFEPATTICRGSAGECDALETCTGSGASCPSDAPEPDGTACGGGTCAAGVCDPASSPAAAPAGGCGCSSGGPDVALLGLLAVTAPLLRRRRR